MRSAKHYGHLRTVYTCQLRTISLRGLLRNRWRRNYRRRSERWSLLGSRSPTSNLWLSSNVGHRRWNLGTYYLHTAMHSSDTLIIDLFKHHQILFLAQSHYKFDMMENIDNLGRSEILNKVTTNRWRHSSEVRTKKDLNCG
jgi:hypothetical protein